MTNTLWWFTFRSHSRLLMSFMLLTSSRLGSPSIAAISPVLPKIKIVEVARCGAPPNCPDFPDPFHAGFQQGKTFSPSSISQLHRKLPSDGCPSPPPKKNRRFPCLNLRWVSKMQAGSPDPACSLAQQITNP